MTSTAEERAKPSMLMNVPIVSQWNINNASVCTPDGGFLYIGTRCISYIADVKQANAHNVPQMKIFHARQNLIGIDIDPAWPNDVNDDKSVRQFAILAEDKSLQIWQFTQSSPLMGHNVHTPAGRYVDGGAMREHVLFGYMRNSNVLSLDSQDTVIYCVASNSYCKLPTFLPTRNQQLNVLRCSPYNEHIIAVGTTRGSVFIADLQRQTIVYTLRGHDAAITALCWISSANKANEPKKSKKLLSKSKPIDVCSNDSGTIQNALDVPPADDDIFDIYDYDYLEQEFGAPTASKATTNTVAAQEAAENFVGLEKPNFLNDAVKFDYVEACQSLLDEIEIIKKEQKSTDGIETCDITLAECQAAAAKQDAVSSDCEDDAEQMSKRSLSMPSCSSSSDDSVDVDGVEQKRKSQILHHVEVHAAHSQTLTRNNEAHVAESAQANKLEDIAEPAQANKQEDIAEPAQANKQADTAESAQTNKQEDSTDILLGSASADGQYFIWNTKTGGACDSMKARAGNHHQPGKNTHLKLVWLSSTAFLTSNKHGDVSQWLLNPPQSEEPNGKIYKYQENRAFLLQDAVMDFAVCTSSDTIWCITARREILCKSLTNDKVWAQYSCLPTNIAAMSECSDNLNLVALACPDRRVGIIDVSSITPTHISIKNYSLRVGSIVTALAWSPDCKKLAFATIEGRVGVFHVEKPHDVPFVFHPVCGTRVYAMTWHKDGIYVVCNQSLVCYDNKLKNKDGKIITAARDVTAVSMKDDYLFVGSQQGYVQVLQRQQGKWQMLQSLKCATRYISYMDWSPVQKDHLAVVSNGNELNVFTFEESSAVLQLKFNLDMKDSRAGCSTVKWSNQQANLLITAGADGAVRVFDVSTACVQKYLKQYDCPMYCAMFMPSNEQVIMCSGKVTALQFIDMQQSPSEDYSLSRWNSAKNAKSNVQWAVKMLPNKATKLTGAAERRRQKRSALENAEELHIKTADNANAENLTNMLNNLDIAENTTETKVSCNLSSTYMKNPSTLLYLTSKELNKEAINLLIDELNAAHNKQHNHSTSLISKLLGSPKQAKELLSRELNNLQETGSVKGHIGQLFMGQLNRTDLKAEILKCVQNRTLNEWHVSMAPSISYPFWKSCCNAFSAQLEELGYILHAATYLLATHDQTATIELLMRNHYYKEAALVARIYLQADAPEFTAIVDKWIEYLHSNGSYPAAALICTLTGQITRGYTILCKLRNTDAEIEQALKLLKTHEKFDN